MKWIIPFLFAASLHAITLNVTNYGAWGDSTNFTVNAVSNSVILHSSIPLPTNSAWAIEVIGAGTNTIGTITNSDLIASITNVTQGTNLFLNRVARATTNGASAFAGTLCSTGLQTCINSAVNGDTILFPSGKYLLLATQLLDNAYIDAGPFEQIQAVTVSKSGIAFQGIDQTNTILYGCGAWTIHPDVVRGFIIKIQGPITNSFDQPLQFKNLTLDGGVSQGRTLNQGFPAYPYTGEGWDLTHGALIMGATAPPFPTNLWIQNCTFRHWRGEMNKTGYDYQSANFNGWTNCTFYDGNATALNWQIGGQVVEGCSFSNIIEVMEFFSSVSLLPNLFENNFIFNCDSGLTVTGGEIPRQPQASTLIQSNSFQVTQWGVNISPLNNVTVRGNYFHDIGQAVLLGGAGGQGDGPVTNIVIYGNTCTNAQNFIVSYGAGGVFVTNNILNGVIASSGFATFYGYGNSWFVSNRSVNSRDGFYANSGIVLPLDDPSNDFPFHPYDDFVGFTNRISYTFGYRQKIEVTHSGSVWCCDDSAPSQIPLGAEMLIANVCGSTVAVFNGINQDGPSFSLANNASKVVYWSGIRWLSSPITPFTFTLDEPCKTSAGVFKTDGTLVRTLWSNIRYTSAGIYSTNWDGNDDWTNASPAGTYVIKVLQHNTEYVWDGFVGNTSEAMSGTTTLQGESGLQDITFTGTNAYVCVGYNEGHFQFKAMHTNDLRSVFSNWFWTRQNGGAIQNAVGHADRNFNFTCSDSTNVYFACDSTFNPINSDSTNNYAAHGAIVASRADDQSRVAFSSGVEITNTSNESIPSGIYVGTQPGLSGLAVQQNSNLLAASSVNENKIFFFNKLTGASNNVISILAPRRLSFGTNGDLWVVCGVASNSVVCITNCNGATPKASLTNSTFSLAAAIAVCPTNKNIILVCDGGTNQQIKAIDATGAALWTYGQAGGYYTNGPAVTTNKFWFDTFGSVYAFLSFTPDGATFWVGDALNARSLHYDLARNYLGQIAILGSNHKICVDKNNSSRVFNAYLEFSVDYTKALTNAWTLVKNWRALEQTNYLTVFSTGLSEACTLTNGRTYAIDYSYDQKYELVELSTNGLRHTGIFPMSPADRWITLEANGDLGGITKGHTYTYLAHLTNFDGSFNPKWDTEALIASASEGSTNPVNRCCNGYNLKTTISTNNVVISFDSTLNSGFHLGGIQRGTTNWLWQTSPTGTLNADGHFQVDGGINAAASCAAVLGRQIVYAYHGEGIGGGQAQAGQFMHYLDDGLFVGQFGECSLNRSAYEGVLAGFAGGNQSPEFIVTNGDYYVWSDDEAGNSLQRWHMVNARNIREMHASVVKDGSASLTNQTYNFPNVVHGTNGNTIASLNWSPVAAAASYKIYYSLFNEGPYQTFAGVTSTTNFTATGLANGTPYYFAVVALIGGIEQTPSEQIKVYPFDTSSFVNLVGHMADGQQLTSIYVSSANLAPSASSWLGQDRKIGSKPLPDFLSEGLGYFPQPNVGTKGYVLYDINGDGIGITNTTAFIVTNNSSFGHTTGTERQYSVDGTLGSTPTQYMYENPAASGIVHIKPTNFNWHYLTLVVPAVASDPRVFTVTMTSTNGSSVSYAVNEPYGLSDTWQFLFRGEVNLNPGAIGAVFLDDDPTASLTDFYVTQNGVAPFTITNSVAGFNAWTNGITAGDTIHLVGTITSGLVMGGSGSVGSPITVFFESGAKLETTYWPVAFNLNGQSNIVIDGGVNGIIDATANGTLLANFQNTIGINAAVCGNNIEVKNLTIGPLFVKVPLVAGDSRNQQPSVQGIFMGMSSVTNITVHNCTLVQCGNAITWNYGGACSYSGVYSNVVSDMSFGVFLNANAAGYSHDFFFTANTMSNLSTYDGAWAGGAHNHNDYFILNSPSSGMVTNDGVLFDRNRLGGNNGTNVTSFIKITPDNYGYRNGKIVNDVFVNTEPTALLNNGMVSGTLATNFLAANNTFVNTGSGASAIALIVGKDGNKISWFVTNNVFFGVSMMENTDQTITNIAGSDYNAMQAGLLDSAFFGNGATFQTTNDWQTRLGFDLHSQIGTPTLGADFAPTISDTVLLNNGVNLTAFGITNDFYGNARPSIGPWTIGAFQSTNSGSPVMIPPVITVQPTDKTTLTNTTAAFSISTTGDSPLYYQWFANGVAATNFNQSPSWTTNSGTPLTNSVFCIVTNASGSETSSIAFWHNTNGILATYSLTVFGGTGSAMGLTNGQVVTVSTNTVVFSLWTGPGAAFLSGQATTANNTITMPASDTTITANYLPLPPSGLRMFVNGGLLKMTNGSLIIR